MVARRRRALTATVDTLHPDSCALGSWSQVERRVCLGQRLLLREAASVGACLRDEPFVRISRQRGTQQVVDRFSPETRAEAGVLLASSNEARQPRSHCGMT